MGWSAFVKAARVAYDDQIGLAVDINRGNGSIMKAAAHWPSSITLHDGMPSSLFLADAQQDRGRAVHATRYSRSDFIVADRRYERCHFGKQSASHGLIENCEFRECLFEGDVYLAKTRFDRVIFHGCTFTGFSFWKVYLDDAEFIDCVFNSVKFVKTSFHDNIRFTNCVFHKAEFGLTRAKVFDVKCCLFSEVHVDLANLDFLADQSHAQCSYFFYMARGLSTCTDGDGSLVETIGNFKFERESILDYLGSANVGLDGKYFIENHASFLAENIKPALELNPLADAVNPLHKSILTDLDRRIVDLVRLRKVNLDDLTPREFEELMAALMRKMGYLAKLTAATRDGGYDIFAIHQGPGGMNSSMLVECKRRSNGGKVGLGIVRGLYTLRCQQEAGAAMIATTSHFSSDAHRYKEKLLNLHLADRDRILAWCSEYGGR